MLFCLQDFPSNTGSQLVKILPGLAALYADQSTFTCFLSFLWSRCQVVEYQGLLTEALRVHKPLSDAPFAVMHLNFACLGKFSGLSISSWDTPYVVSRRSDSSYSSMERVFPVKGTDIVVRVICCILHKLAVELWYIFPLVYHCALINGASKTLGHTACISACPIDTNLSLVAKIPCKNT